MLYVSTRNPQETHTARKALEETRAADGGFYVPCSGKENLAADISGRRFGDNVARMMNHMFQAGMTEHDVRLAAGRNPVRISALANRILMAELWHNLENDYACLARNLARHVCPDASLQNGSWARVGVGISILFGVFGELMGKGLASEEKKVDISLVSGDFTLAMAAWYARRFGLPIGNIVCCCNENSAVWNLFTHGALRTDGISIPTLTPEADVCIPDSLERLIYECGGSREAECYLEHMRKGETYYPDDLVLSRLRQGMYVSVVNTPRMMDIIPNACTTHNYVLSPYSALAYGGLLDYRAVSGESRRSLILAEKSPAVDRDTVSQALGLDFDI